MNKYQEALDNIKSEEKLVIYTNDEWQNVFDDDNKNIALIQELVDKATSMKPLNQRINHNGLKVGTCNCKVYVGNDCIGYTVIDETFDFCKKCGQAIDWSTNE